MKRIPHENQLEILMDKQEKEKRLRELIHERKVRVLPAVFQIPSGQDLEVRFLNQASLIEQTLFDQRYKAALALLDAALFEQPDHWYYEYKRAVCQFHISESSLARRACYLAEVIEEETEDIRFSEIEDPALASFLAFNIFSDVISSALDLIWDRMAKQMLKDFDQRDPDLYRDVLAAMNLFAWAFGFLELEYLSMDISNLYIRSLFSMMTKSLSACQISLNLLQKEEQEHLAKCIDARSKKDSSEEAISCAASADEMLQEAGLLNLREFQESLLIKQAALYNLRTIQDTDPAVVRLNMLIQSLETLIERINQLEPRFESENAAIMA